MKSIIKQNRWSPYLTGTLIGTLLVFLFLFGQRFGTSTGISKISSLVESIFFSNFIGTKTSFSTIIKNQNIFDWPLFFVLGIFLGSWISTKTTMPLKEERNTVWIKKFGSSKIKRAIASFIGGVLLMLGARIADGCTSGHVITGGIQLSIVSFIFMISMFSIAVPFSIWFYKK